MRMLPPHLTLQMYEGLASLPLYNPDLDTSEPPPAVTEFRNLLAASAGVLICTPEYAFGVPGALKNALDWTVSSAHFDNKPTALITASSSGRLAHEALLHTLRAINAKMDPAAALLISFIRTKLNPRGEFTDHETELAVNNVVNALVRTIGL